MNKRLLAIIGVIILVGGGFYWFQWRPSNLRQVCYWESRAKGLNVEVSQIKDEQNNSKKLNPEIWDGYYRLCLAKHGMKPETLLP